MKVREIMSTNPVCCLATDTAQHVAQIMRTQNVGSVPVVDDLQSRKLLGMITDRDLCLAIVAQGLNPTNTAIKPYLTVRAHSCREGENIEACARLMREHQVRRIPVVDGGGCVVGIVAQADLALKANSDTFHKTIREVSKAGRPSIAA
jgi:CBS domain-containing protein